MPNNPTFSFIFPQHWSPNLSASSVKMKMVPLFTITLPMDTGMVTMGLVLVEIMEQLLITIIAMATMVTFLETMDMGTVMKKKSKTIDTPIAVAVETLSHCPSVPILFLFRSRLHCFNYIILCYLQ